MTAASRDWAYRVSRGLLFLLLGGFTRRYLHGRAHIGRQKGRVRAGVEPHQPFRRPLLVMATPCVIDWVTAAEFFTPAPLAAWMYESGGIAIRRTGGPDVGAVREALRRLRRGRVLGMFPEGGIRAGAGSVLEGARPRRGVAWLAARERVPVVPCVVLGSDRLYDPHRWRFWRGRVPVWIGFGPAITPDEWAAAGASDLLGERLRALYAEMRTVFHLRPEDLPTTPQRRQAHF